MQPDTSHRFRLTPGLAFIPLLYLMGVHLSNAQSYTLSQVGTYSIEIDNPTYFSVNQDDATQIPIGFDFEFFGVTYTDCWVGGDGFISFGDYPTPSCCGELIPDNTTPNNLIAVAWMNVDWISAHYEVFGSAPNRRIVITYDLRNPCDSSYYGQVKLFETTNVIEIHTQQWNGGECQGWTVTQGLENATGSVAYPVPGRNYNDIWQVNPGDDDFVSFSPNNFGYLVEEDDADFQLELNLPNDITVYQDSYQEVLLDFPFEFFGSSYSSLFIGFNGFISFEEPFGGGCCEGQSIPHPNNPNNLIAAAWTDVSPNFNGYNIYQYGVTGSSPNRRFIVNFYFDDACYNTYYSGQIHLLEGSDIIEIHTEVWGEWNQPCSNTTQGIEDAGGNNAYYLPGRNSNMDWNVGCCGDLVRFTPLASLPQSDAGVSYIYNDPYCEGPNMMRLLVRNFGGSQIDSVQIHWTWDGAPQDSISANFPMPVGDGNYYVELDSQQLVYGQTYELKAWTSMPNGMMDDNQANDTLTAMITVGLHGSFTIGGTSPDFNTIQEAVDSLQSIGICDTVTMLIRPGTYNEQVIIPYIAGAFGKQIIFTAENGDSTSVIVEYNATHEDSNYVVMFTNAFDITWEKMTLNALGTFQAVVFELRNYSVHNTIQHCSINGKETTSNSYDYACIFSRAQNNDNRFLYNTLRNGSFGYFHEIIPPGVIIGLQENSNQSRGTGSGDPEDYVERTLLNGNTFLNFARSAIRTTWTKGMQIHNNYMESSQTNVWAMHINEDLDSISISNNTAYLPNGQYALHLSNVDPATGTRASIFNNMFNLPGTYTSIIGTGLYNCTNLDFYHNTIRIHNTSASSFPFYHAGGAIDSVYNNIFANTSSGPAIYTNSSFLHHYDYNNYHTNGNILGTYGSAVNNAPDMATWQFFTGFDHHSTSFDPLFIADTNLHVRATLLNGIGSPQLSTSQDIDGELRNPTHPDPGADEFSPSNDDAAITGILSPNMICDPEQDIKLVLANLGLDSLLSITIEWTINDVPQTPFSTLTSLGPEGDTSQIVLASHIFSNQPDTLRFWTVMPNGNVDTQPENDTLTFIFRLPLQGVFTIGGISPDFSSFSAAVQAMKQFTICGPVTFKVRNGVYTEQVILDSITGSSSTNTITFESESLDSSAVTLQYSSTSTSNNFVVQVKGTDYLTFRHLSFVSLNTFYADIIDLRNGVTHLTLSNNYFDGTHLTGSSGIAVKSFAFGVNEYFTIQNNYFKDGHHALYFINPGSSLESRSRGLLIEDNIMENQRYYGIRISQAQGLQIRNNHISTNSPNGYIGLDLNSIHMATEISGNTINYLNSGSAMFLNSLNFQSTPGIARIFNNMVKSATTGDGIRVWNSRRVHIQFNTSYASGSGNAFELVGGDSCLIQNNIFVANTGRAISSGISTPPTTTSDYNDFYSIAGNTGYWNNTNYPTLLDWQSGTGFDTHSMSIDPEFVSSTDLHVLADTLDGAGLAVSGINVDFDGQPRNAMTPDIGADEIGANDDDAGVLVLLPEMPFGRGQQDVKAVVRNYGGNTITSVDIHWELNNVPQSVINYSNTIPSLQEDTVILGNVAFLLNTPYTIKAWTAAPNATMDLYPSNDTLLTNTRYAAVSDTVTIGGSSPDVPTIAAALSALSFGGVLDSVHFQIRNGIYHTSLTLPQTIGMNCTTPIIFESESGNAANVIWDNEGLTASTVTLDGADGITFKNLTIKTVVALYPAVTFKSGAHCNTFEGCILEGLTTTNPVTGMAVVYSHGSQNNTNTFKENIIKRGSYGIYWDGGYTTTGSQIKNNSIEDAYYSGITLANILAPVVHQNTITSNTSIGYFYGVYLYNCSQQSSVTSNQIYLPGIRGVGILLSVCHGTVSQPGLVANNFVLLGGGTSSYGIQHYYSSWSNIYFNTVRITGGATSGFPYYRTYATNVHIKNNIFDNRASGVAMHFGGNEGPWTSNFNDLYSSGNHLVHYAGTNYTDLEAWQETDFDTNSVFQNPMYAVETGYVVTNAALNGAAIPIASLPTDIEGLARDPITPDIGCDEFEPFNDDVGILSINYPRKPFPSGLNTVFIKFSNNGLDTLVSMQVNWEVDSIPQPAYFWTGLLPSAGTYDSLDIGEFDFAPYRNHTIKVWVSDPNGMMDELSSNDTLVVDSLYPALEGIYTVGGANPDFDSLAIAVDVLNTGGASGPVTLNIRSGTYLETINLTDYPGSDCNRPVTFQSESGDSTSVIITNLGINDNIVTLNGADGVIFKNLTLTSVNPGYRNVVDYFNGAHCNQFLNNHIKGYESSSTSFTDAVIRSGTSLDTANRFANNWIEHGSAAFYLVGNGIASNTVIENNLLDQNYYHGIYASSESKINILGNVVLGSTASFYRGIYLEYCHGANRIESNDLRCNSTDNIIRLETCHGTPGLRPRIVNNFFSSNGTAGSNAFMINNCKRYDVFHNNISLTSTAGSTALYFHTDSSLHLSNNIVVNNGAGQILYGNNQTSFISDYNDYFGVNSFGTWNGAAVADLGAWIAATNQDTHSLDVNPQYMSPSDLHISNILLNGAGQGQASVTVDIDGDARNLVPDIGADEFDPSIANDAGVFMYMGPTAPFAPGSQPVTIALKNYGYTTLTSAEIRWIVNGIEQPIYEWTGSLGSAQCDTVVIGSYTFPEYTGHTLILWSESPNGVPDSTHVNDTILVENVYPALSGTYTVGGVLPDFNLFPQLQEALNNGGILNDVTFDIRNGNYSTQLVIENFPRTNYAHEVLFKSESGDSSQVTIRKDYYHPATNYTVRLSDAHHIVFEALTLASTQGRILDIADGSSHITVQRCRFRGVDINYIASHQLIYSNTTTEDSLYIIGNRFEEGDYGLFLTSSGGDPETEVVIENNYFYNVRYRSIHTHNHTGLKIKGNTIFNNQHEHEGMAIIASVNTKEISGNDIRLHAGGQYGMYLHYVSGSSGTPARIYNNYILIRNWVHNAYGISQSNGNYNNHSFNTIRLENTGVSSVPFGDYQSTNIHIRNCLLANYSGGLTIQNNWFTGTTNTMDYCDLYTTGSVLAQYYYTYNDLQALQVGTSQNLNSISAEPLFSTLDPYIFQAACDGAALPIAGILTDLEGQARHVTNPDIGCDEFTLLAHDIGAKLLLDPETYCGLSFMEPITIRIQNYGSSAETGFDVAYSVNGSAWIVENVGALNIAPGGTGDYTFTVSEDLSAVGLYTFALRTSLGADLNLANDTLWNIEVTHIPALTIPVSNMIPSDGEVDLDKPISLSWAPSPDATHYDVYIWVSSGSQPGTPQIANLTQINTLYNELIYGETYKWRVVAKNICNQMVAGPIQEFTIRYLPDIIIDTVIAPPTAFSGEQIEIEWQTKNIGTGASLSQVWADAVFLSTDATLNLSYDTYLGSVQNLTALDSNEAYTNTGTFMIPNGFTGNYYVFVYADRWLNLIESDNNNNGGRTPSPMMINLSPNADLTVLTVVAPSTTFSGLSIPITATVKNIGTGPTQISTWYDRIYFGSDPLNYGTGQHIATITHNGVLAVDSTYQVQANVSIPQGIFGDRYVYVVSDFNNDVFENAAESNNVGISDTIDVILTPPADLITSDFIFLDTMHNNQPTSLQYMVVNQGGSTVSTNQWYDNLYISQAPVYNLNFLSSIGGVNNYGPLMPSDPSPRTHFFTMPVWASGEYYFYIQQDAYNQVFEHTFENNNVNRSAGTVVVVNPDFATENIIHPDTCTAGQSISITWDLINAGPGHIYNRYWQNKIYLSDEETFSIGDAILLKTLYPYSSFLEAADTLPQSTTVTIPEGITGQYYFHIHSDAAHQIFENEIEENNIGSSSIPIQINLPPYPDLISREVVVPDTAIAGEVFLLTYEVANIGTAPATAISVDSFFLSFSPSWNPISNIYLGRKTGIPALSVQDSFAANATLLIPVQQTSNIYYLYIKSDATSTVYEYVNESNNIKRSSAFFVAPAPAVDLRADTLICNDDTLRSGRPFTISWIVTNMSEGNASAAGWRDALYLSVDSVLNKDLDTRFFNTEAGLGGLEPYENYLLNATPTLPPGISGNYYMILVTDDNGIHLDEDTLNNQNSLRQSGVATPLHIALSPSPDLLPVLFNAPANAYSGQPFSIQWSIRNDGDTTATSWTDKIYLSTDNEINQGDILLSSITQTNTNLLPGQQIMDTAIVFVNSQYQGNYILILKTDADQLIYEHQAEANNNITRSILFTPPPPSDLLVTSILIPDSTVAGNTISISWQTMNNGTNPTNGLLREIVYLSEDDIFDVNDRLFGLTDLSLFIPPGNAIPRSMAAKVSGVAQGDYYAIVQTDARDNITESNDNNNITASNDVMNVAIEELFLDSLTIDSFNNAQEHYFRLNIPFSEQGQNLRVTIDGDSLGLYTEMYIKFATAPTLSDFEEKHLYPFQQDQEMLLEGIQGGTYYLMFKGHTTHSTGQKVTLLARIVDFELLSIAPEKGLNRGQTTIALLGTQMDTLRKVYLYAEESYVIDPVNGTSSYPLIFIPGSHQNWNAADSLSILVSKTSNGIYEGFHYLPDSLNQLLITTAPSWTTVYGDDMADGSLDLNGDTIIVASPGFYKFVVNLNNLSYSIIKTQWALTGSAILTDGELDPGMNYNAFDSLWSIELELGEGGISFISTGDTPTALGDNGADGLLDFNGSEILITEPGLYRINLHLDPMDPTYSIQLPNELLIEADTIYEINSSRAFATFTLDDVTPGLYTVQASRWDGKVAELFDAFEVLSQGEESDLQILLEYPAAVGARNGPMKITIFMQNAGDQDILNQSFIFEAPWGNLLARTYEDLVSGNTESSIEIPVQGAFGPPGILAPKAGNVVEIFAFSRPHPTFTLTPIEE